MFNLNQTSQSFSSNEKLSSDSRLKYSIIELKDSKFIKIMEFSNDILEISQRIKHLNSNCWNSTYMVCKQY